jgi:uncharacterized OB-fold protein
MALTQRVTRNDELGTVTGGIPLGHVYTAGVAGERVLRELKENGQLLGTRCAACGVTYAPARLYCERCLSRLDEWIPIPLKGRLASFAIVHRDVDDQPLSTPTLVGLIELDGATGALVHLLGGAPTGEFQIGRRVSARLRAPSERVGSIVDIEYFYPSE